MRLSRTLALATFAAVTTGLAPVAAAQTASGDFDAYLRRCAAAHVCNGAYLVARNGEPIYAGAVGDAGDGAQTPLTTHSAFDIGSISKQFTAIAVLKLVAEGRLSLEDPVTRLLPDFPYPDVTVVQLLTHTSGVPDAIEDYNDDLRAGRGPFNGEDIVRRLVAAGRPLAFTPGSRFQYNNAGYMVLANVVEAASGQPFSTYLDQAFFKPLGMSETHLLTSGAEGVVTHRAFGFRPRPDVPRRALDQIPGFYVRGAGGLYSTVGDLLIWQNALNAGRVIPSDLLRRATEPTRLSDGTTTPYGFGGLNLRPDSDGGRRVWHGGHWRAFKSDLSYYPDTGLTVIQLTNNAEDDSVDANAAALAAIAAGRTPTAAKASIQWDLYDRVASGDAPAVRAWFTAEAAAQPRRYEIVEGELNALGYRLIEAGNPARGALVLEMNTLAFPQSANTFDSLAEAQEALGDRAAALANVRRAVALDPASAPLREHLARLEAPRP